jgi:hypothetical protein
LEETDLSWLAVQDSIMYTAIEMFLHDTIGALKSQKVGLNGKNHHNPVSAASAKHVDCSNCGKCGHQSSKCQKKKNSKTKAGAETTVKLRGYGSGSFDYEEKIGVIYK